MFHRETAKAEHGESMAWSVEARSAHRKQRKMLGLYAKPACLRQSQESKPGQRLCHRTDSYLGTVSLWRKHCSRTCLRRKLSFCCMQIALRGNLARRGVLL